MVTSGETFATPFRNWIERAEQLGARGRFEIGVPMRDGVELAADVYLPPGAEEEPVPAIVTATPYGKDGETLVSDEAVSYQSHGYAFVAADVRGRGKSEGDWLAFVNDAKDTHDIIEWAAVESVPQLLDAVVGYLAEGYQRIKLKIEQGWDVEPVRGSRAVRRHPAPGGRERRLHPGRSPSAGRPGPLQLAAHRAAAARGRRARSRGARPHAPHPDLPG